MRCVSRICNVLFWFFAPVELKSLLNASNLRMIMEIREESLVVSAKYKVRE